MEAAIEMTLDKETKGSVRYAEKGDPAEQILRTLYIRKRAFSEGAPYPDEIKVTIKSE